MGAAEIDATMRSTFTPEVVAEMFKISLSGGSSGHKKMVELVRGADRRAHVRRHADPARRS